MALNGNKARIEFPYEIKKAEGDIREQFIRDFQGRLDIKKKVERVLKDNAVENIIILGDKELSHKKVKLWRMQETIFSGLAYILRFVHFEMMKYSVMVIVVFREDN